MDSDAHKCPVCNFELVKTEFFNSIFKEFNYYCSKCDSYHILIETDDRAYYSEKYHTDFKYEIESFRYKIINFFPFLVYRSISKFDFLNQYVKYKKPIDILEIGAATGENFIIFNKKMMIRRYIIIEPGPVMHIKHKKVTHLKDTFENVDLKNFENAQLIMMFHVLEHIFNYDNFFYKLNQLNFDSFYLEVPNISDEKTKLDSLLNNPHYHHFSKKSLQMLLKKHDFEEVSLQTIEPISYHPYKHISMVRKYLLRLFHVNEKFKADTGIYIRGIFKKSR